MLGLMSRGAAIMPSDRRADFGWTPSPSGADRLSAVRTAITWYGVCCGSVGPRLGAVHTRLTLDSAVPHTPPQGAGGTTPVLHKVQKPTSHRGSRVEPASERHRHVDRPVPRVFELVTFVSSGSCLDLDCLLSLEPWLSSCRAVEAPSSRCRGRCRGAVKALPVEPVE